MNNSSQPLTLIWDLDDFPNMESSDIILWSSFNETDNKDIISMPLYIEENGDELKALYLSWIFELGESYIKDKTLIDHLQIRRNFSYWWMTGIAQKKMITSMPEITNAIKLIALERLVQSNGILGIHLHTQNSVLKSILKEWCFRRKIVFKCEFSRPLIPSEKRGIASKLPPAIKAAGWLMLFLSKRIVFLRRRTKLANKVSAKAITFFNYFTNLREESSQERKFSSSYWGTLPESIRAMGYSQEWFHMFVVNGTVPSAQKAATAALNFEEGVSGINSHEFIDEYVSGKVLFYTLIDYIKVAIMGIKLYRAKRLFLYKESELNLWSVFSKDWRDSFFGIGAISNCLYLNLFDDLLKTNLKKKVGFYLLENQPWELAMIAAWKANGHGTLVGIPHSTVRFWDLRYFNDRRTFNTAGLHGLPKPDLIAANGRAACDAYTKWGYPSSELVEIEALRYLYVANNNKYQKKEIEEMDPLRILVLGDYSLPETQMQIKCLESAVRYVKGNLIFLVKPHPACPIVLSDYPSLSMEIVEEPLNELIGKCDVAFTSNSTSASVDMYLSGVPVISMLDPRKLNMSPLREIKDINFISSPKELAKAFDRIRKLTSIPSAINYFTVDKGLPRWKHLVSRLSGVRL